MSQDVKVCLLFV